MKKLPNYFILLLLLNTAIVKSQDNYNSEIVKNSVQAEIATILFAGKYDISYERFIFQVEGLEFFTRISCGEWYSTDMIQNFTTGKSVSLSISEFSSISNHRFEFSFGGKYGTVNNDRKTNGTYTKLLNRPLRPVFSIGYRYQKHKNGIIFRSFICDWGLGIGLGYGF